MPQVAETWRSGRLGDWTIRSFGWENQRSIICQVLGNDYPMASLLCSFFCVLPCFPPFASVKAGCSDGCPPIWIVPAKPFDQVVWPTTRSRPIVNVSMCLLLCVVFSFLNRINGPVMKLTVRWLTPFSNLEMRPIGRESLNKQNLLCFYPHAHTHRHTIRQPLTGLCQNTAQNKAHRAVWATVKCYGLNGNWQSGWARLSKAICELEEQNRRQRGVFFVF